MVIKRKGEPLLGKETATELGALEIGDNIATIRNSTQFCLEEWESSTPNRLAYTLMIL